MIIAVAGLSGAGKTTAVEHLQLRGVGKLVYVGAYVQAEVRRRGLALTPENEQLVRRSLRDDLGLDALARMACEDLRSMIQSDVILLDAICLKEEGDFYRAVLGSNLLVIGISASFEVRAERLALRRERPLTADQLRARDLFELEKLRLGDVLDAADHRLTNEESLDAFKLALETLVAG